MFVVFKIVEASLKNYFIRLLFQITLIMAIIVIRLIYRKFIYTIDVGEKMEKLQ